MPDQSAQEYFAAQADDARAKAALSISWEAEAEHLKRAAALQKMSLMMPEVIQVRRIS